VSVHSFFLADDHPVTRLGVMQVIAQAPWLTSAGEAADGEAAVSALLKLRPQLALVDLKLPVRSGLQVLEALAQARSPTRVLMFSGQGTGEDARRAKELGAWGFLDKATVTTALLRALEEVAAGRPTWTVAQREAFRGEAGRPALSPRELEVLRHLASGASNKQIADKLGLADGTVRIHLSNIFGKLEVSDRTAAVTLGLKLRLIELE
jgi:DNA-binding NarL/FixJ family response regulator